MERQDQAHEYMGDLGFDGGQRIALPGLPNCGGAVEAEEAGERVRGEGYGGSGEGGIGA